MIRFLFRSFGMLLGRSIASLLLRFFKRKTQKEVGISQVRESLLENFDISFICKEMVFINHWLI